MIALRSFPIGNALLTTVLLSVSRIRVRDYLIGSALSMLPASLTFALLGSAAHDHTLLRLAIAAAMIAAVVAIQWWIWPRMKLANALRS